MRRALRWLLPVLAVLLFLWGGGTVRRVCAEAQYPFQRASGWARGQVTQRLAAAWRGLCDGPARLDAEAEADRLRTMLREADRLAAENAELRRALGWARGQEARLVAAPILSHGGGLGVWPRLTLGVGAAHGVGPGDVVVAPEGLVGRVAEVTAHTSTVMLLSDPASRVAAVIPGVATGIVEGDAGEDFGADAGESLLYAPRPLAMRFVDKDAALKPRRQTVLTEGSGGRYPRGLVIGTLVARKRETSDLLAEAWVEPAVDPTLLRVVFVRVRGAVGGDDAR